MKAVFLQAARADLHEIRRYIVAKFGAPTWVETRRKIQVAVAQIEAFPLKGGTPPELGELGIGECYQVISGMNRIVYQIDGDTLYVHLVADARRDLKDVLARRLFRA